MTLTTPLHFYSGNNSVPIMDRGLLYAESCFETLRVVNGAIFAWSAHAERLARGLKAFGITLDDAALSEIHQQALSVGQAEGNDALVRLTVTGGEAPWGLTVPATRTLSAIVHAKPAEAAPASAILFSTEWPFPLREKFAKFTADYAEMLKALQHCSANPAAEPLFVGKGNILATATANVLLYRNEQWITPSGMGVLPGVVRQTLIAQGLVRITDCPEHFLADCDAIALCNSGFFLREVAMIDGRQLKASEAIQSLWNAIADLPGVVSVHP